jgi:trimethylamine---corrinoid protein Co-methyltransferase
MRKRMKKILRLYDSAIEAEKRFEFQNARKYYRMIASLYPGSTEAQIAAERIEELDALSNEKRIYYRVDRNARRILTEIGIDISNSPVLMELLMEADAIDLDSKHALFTPMLHKKDRKNLTKCYVR